jgi:hypothetical protein
MEGPKTDWIITPQDAFTKFDYNVGVVETWLGVFPGGEF